MTTLFLDSLDQLVTGPVRRSEPDEPVLLRRSVFPLWGGKAAVLTEADALTHRMAVRLVREATDRVDVAASTWRDDSELVTLNHAEGRWTEVSGLLLQMIEAATDAARRSRGAVDPTVGSITLAERPGRGRVTRTGSWRDVEVDSLAGTVRLPRGTMLDLGATGKAFAADLAATTVSQLLGVPVLVNLGGDLRCFGTPAGGGWRVLVTHDHRREPDRASGTDQAVLLHDGALATSSTVVRRKVAPQGRVGVHVLDPWTGRPVTGGWQTATVCASDCVSANAASTAALVLGCGAEDFMRSNGLPARLVGYDDAVLELGAWPGQVRAA